MKKFLKRFPAGLWKFHMDYSIIKKKIDWIERLLYEERFEIR